MGVCTLYRTGGSLICCDLGSVRDSVDDGVGGLEAGGLLGVTEADLRLRGGRIEPEPKVREDEPEDERVSWEPEGPVPSVATGGSGRGRRTVEA